MNIEAKYVVAVKAIHITQVRYCACAQQKNGMWTLPLGPEVGCIERKNRERESARDFTAIHPPLFVVLATRDGDRQGDVLAKAD